MSVATLDPQSGLRATIREAIRGSRQDYTEAPIGRAVILLSRSLRRV